ncbi:MAG: hypothetical protein AAFQ37_09525 [Bacteroidota bacterium]
MFKFESNLKGAFDAKGIKCGIYELPDVPGGDFPADGPFDPVPTNAIVQSDQPIKVEVEFQVSGALAAALCDYTWECAVLVEKWGCDEHCPDPAVVSFKHLPRKRHTYKQAVTLPANTFTPGYYKLVVCLNLISCNKKPMPVAGFCDLGPIKVYEAA